MGESDGGVALHEDVAVPGEAVTKERGEEEEPRVEEEEGGEEAEECGEGAEEMPPPGRRLGVLAHIIRPELLQAPEIHVLSSSLSLSLSTLEYNPQPF